MNDSTQGETTTEDVREYFAMSEDGLDFKRAAQERREEFDRWLRAHDAAVWDEGFAAGWTQADVYENPYGAGSEQ